MAPFKVIPANESFLRRLLNPIAPMNRFWMTYRLPLQRYTRITYPPGTVLGSKSAIAVASHEMVHEKQFRKWWGPWLIPLFAALLPLPVLFSGRWFIERSAYLKDIKEGYRTVPDAVNILWSAYGWCWPRPLMRRWFEKKLSEG